MKTRHRAVARAATAVAALALTFTGLPAHAAPATTMPVTAPSSVNGTYLSKAAVNPVIKPAAMPTAKQPAGVAYLTTANVNLRQGASTTHAVVRKLAKGTTATSTGKTSGVWVQVKTGTTTGWVHSRYLSMAATAYRTTANVNLRQGASTTHAVVRKIAKGTTATSTGKVSGIWVQVKAGTTTGWVHSRYLATAAVEKPAAEKVTTAYLATANVNLRQGASTTHAVVRKLAKGTTATGTGSTSGVWVQVKAGTTTGWVHSRYLATAVVETAPKPAPEPVTPKPTPKPTPVSVPASFTATGSGWGHGVGMSQYGARAMAAAGFTSTQILNHYYGPATVTDSTHRAAQNIKVHLTSVTSSAITAKATSGATGRLRVHAGDTPITSGTGTVTLTVSGGKVVATLPTGAKKTGTRIDIEWPGTATFSGTPTTVRVPKANGTAGTLELRHGRLTVTVIGGKLNIVNELRMTDEYLYGLAEMPSSWPAAALQSQAIASRSYALRNMGSVKSACDCHVWDEVKSQKFTGWGKENERSASTHWGSRWTASVDATITRNSSGTPARAKSLWYGGAVADATYYSANGGHTRNSHDVWVSAVPYLTARPDPYSLAATANNPNATWTATVTQAQLAKAFGVKDIVKVSVKQGADLTPASLTAITAAGEKVTITGKAFRSAVPLKAAWLRSITAR